MKRIISLVFTLFSFALLHAQYKVQFILKDQTTIYHDSIYITGTFSNWDSTPNKKYLMQPYTENEKSITLNLPGGTIRYKFHRGSWLTVEKNSIGNEVPDRVIAINKDTTLTDSVVAWRDVMLIDKKKALLHETLDTNRVSLLSAIANIYAFNTDYYNADSALFYAQNALQLQQKIMASDEYKSQLLAGNSFHLIRLQETLASLLHALGNYPKALEIRFENLKLAEKEKDKFSMAYTISKITDDYISMKDYQNALTYGKLMDSILNTLDKNASGFNFLQAQSKSIIATAYYNLGIVDSALYYANKTAAINTGNKEGDMAFNSLLLGNIYAKKGDDSAAFYQYSIAYRNAFLIYNPQVAADAIAGMARIFQKRGRLDSALYYARSAMGLLQNYKSSVQAWGENTETYIAEISPLVAELYKANGQPDSAYKYLQLSVTLKDSLYNSDKVRQFQTLSFNEASRREQIERQSKEAKQQYQTRLKMYALVAGMAVFLVLAFVLYRNNKNKQKANILLQEQKQEIETTLGELKTTQKQLVQSEKMASLGELTAGIAHEIQNPLNFVNNFSEVNTELIEEADQEIDKGNLSEVKIILNDIKENEQKINHHGKRADAIVKGMLQHSRSSTGVKEPTDINALADEYLRLAYHGLRAKDKSFNATMKTDFDNSIGNINIIPQDIGRVVLNLLTNAFYVVDEKKKSGVDNYEPTVSISTKKMDNKVEIKVSDNGNGIPQKVLDKIFQPFFTTKPTGQGTGLGLSLSYDIVKAHGGELKVETKEGKGSTFIIQIPVV
jgi:two-component system NtrC family sensor kinase